MTKPDMIDPSNAKSAGNVLLRRALVGSLAGFAAIFLAGVFAGYFGVAAERQSLRLVDLVILVCIAGLLAMVIYGAWKFWPSASGEPVAESTRKGARIMYVMCGLGAIMGIAFGVADDSGSMSLFSNGPIGNVTAIVAILGWAVLVPILTLMWWRTVDEHETAVYAESGLISAHVYLIGAPTWWLATRAGWLPAQDPMIVWLVVATVWTVIWLYRRYF